MIFPLYGDSYGQLAGQQAGYDNFYNGIQQANAARLADANNRNLEMAFRTRELQAQDARTMAAQDEDARRYAIGLEMAAQNRADQISQAKTANDYQQMAFKARTANDAALLQLERDKLAAMQAGKVSPDEQALALSDHLGQLSDAADAAAAQTASNQQRIAAVKANAERNGFKLVDDRRGNLTFVYNRQTPQAPGGVTADQLNGALLDAMKQDKAAQAAALRAKHDFEKNLWNAKQLGIRSGFTVGDNSIRTKSGGEYRFGSGSTSPTASTAAQPSGRLDASGNFIPAGGEGGAAAPATTLAPTQPTVQFTPPPQYQTEGVFPTTARAIGTGLDAIDSGWRWAKNNYIPTSIPEATQGVVEGLRGVRNFFIRPTPGSAAERMQLDSEARQDYKRFFPPPTPDSGADYSAPVY